MAKIQFIERTRSVATTLAQILEQVDSLAAAYNDRGYQPGGTDPIVDADLAGTGLTAAQFNATASALGQLLRWRDNLAVATGDYGRDLNRVRTDM